jgi:alkylation response protein AidB-like acyl-CoA dehydrogenase
VKDLTGDALAAAVGAWLDEHPVGTMTYLRELGESGLCVASWPVEHGGLGMTGAQEAVVEQVLARRGGARSAHDFVGLVLVGPVLQRFGSAEQQQRFLPPLVRSEEFWCQLFSEPGAGSDLAGLGTRAERLPDGRWRVNGQKVWSSLAHHADHGLLLARTDTAVAKHAGITAFLLDMRLPGVGCHPLVQMTGEDEFDEVFLTDVVLDDSARVGEVGQGWAVAVSTLSAERSGLGGQPAVGGGLSSDLVARARSTGAWEDPLLRDDLVAAWIEERAVEITNLRAYSSGQSGAGGSVTKLAQSELLQRLALLRTEVEPTKAVSWHESDAHSQEVARGFLYARAYTIAGGTSEIQRTIIGERVLGLPREPRP